MGDNIYIFSNSYKPVLGGLQTVTSQFAESLIQRGEKAIVVTNVSRKAFAPYSNIDDVAVFRFHFGYRVTFLLLWLLFLMKRPKAVYVHFPLSQVPYVLRLRKHFSFKLVVCFHGHDVLRYTEGDSKESTCFRYQCEILKCADAVTACSKYLAGIVETTFNHSGVIPVFNGVDVSRYKFQTDAPQDIQTPYVFAFGRLEKIKGFDMLIRSFSHLEEKDHYHLYIAGEGTERLHLEEQIKKLCLSKHVFLIGRQTPEKIVQLSQHAEALVIPSLREPFGVVVLEALAAKRPVIATNAGGIPEIMDQRFGIMVSPTIEGLLKGLNKMLFTPSPHDFSQVDAYLSAFKVEKMVDNYLSMIE